MATILELSEEKQNLIDTLFFNEDDKELIDARLNAIQGTASQKLSYLCDVLV